MTEVKSSLVQSLQTAAAQAGLILVSTTQGSDFHGEPTTIFELGLNDGSNRTLKLELSHDFDFDKPNLLPEMAAHLAAKAKRLRNPRPECYVTLGGLPLPSASLSGPSTAPHREPTPTSSTAKCTWPTAARTTCTPR
jgi:hypothetical protein